MGMGREVSAWRGMVRSESRCVNVQSEGSQSVSMWWWRRVKTSVLMVL